jgi:predicted nucleic acid-binding Zn ribbon protein
MTEADYLKCACAHCGGVISYAPTEAGQIIYCQHCGERSRLPGKPKELRLHPLSPFPEKPLKKCPDCGSEMLPEEKVCPYCAEQLRKRHKRNLILASCGGVVVILAAVAGWNAWSKHLKERSQGPALTPAAAFSKVPLAQPPTHPAKSISNLKIGKFYLETDRNGKGPAVATGKIQNDSDNMHFGVKVDLDVLDAAGAKIGAVSDTITQLGPRDNWNFIATVTNTSAATVRFANIKEDE